MDDIKVARELVEVAKELTSSLRDEDIFDGARFFDPRRGKEGTIVRKKYHQTWLWMMLWDNGEIEELTNEDSRRIRKI